MAIEAVCALVLGGDEDNTLVRAGAIKICEKLRDLPLDLHLVAVEPSDYLAWTPSISVDGLKTFGEAVASIAETFTVDAQSSKSAFASQIMAPMSQSSVQQHVLYAAVVCPHCVLTCLAHY